MLALLMKTEQSFATSSVLNGSVEVVTHDLNTWDLCSEVTLTGLEEVLKASTKTNSISAMSD